MMEIGYKADRNEKVYYYYYCCGVAIYVAQSTETALQILLQRSNLHFRHLLMYLLYAANTETLPVGFLLLIL